MIKLSKASKMPCRSWSLQALDTCPASKDANGALVPACSGCYATSGNYRYPNVKAPRVHNREDWQRDSWVDDMVAELDNDRYFRWFDSGDMYHIGLAKKIYQVMQRTSWVKHWLPTRMYKFSKFSGVISDMSALPNVVVRLSSDHIDGTKVSTDLPNSTIIAEGQSVDATVCEAYTRQGKCGPCRSCWDKTVQTIAYIGHGKSMVKKQSHIIAKG